MTVEGEGGGDLEDILLVAPTYRRSTAGVMELDYIQLHPLCSRRLDCRASRLEEVTRTSLLSCHVLTKAC